MATFDDFIGIWDNNVDENICKELIKYYDWTIENNYNISPDINGSRIQAPGQEDESIFLNSSSPLTLSSFQVEPVAKSIILA